MQGLSLDLRLQRVSAAVAAMSKLGVEPWRSCGHIFGREERKRSMMRFAEIEKIAARVAVGALALVSLLSMTASTRAQDAERPYPKMLPLSQYLMDRNAAIALARSAAPEGISKDASVLVLTPKGWETAVKGTNGFVCMA